MTRSAAAARPVARAGGAPAKRSARAGRARATGAAGRADRGRTRQGPAAAIPAYRPQLATLVRQAPAGEQWLHEQKFDGYRIGARLQRGAVELVSRRGQDWTAEFPTVVAALRELGVREALLDGEVAAVLPSGVTSFQALQNRRSGANLVYFVFDLLFHDGTDLRDRPLEERKELLRRLLAAHPSDTLRYSDHVIGAGAAFFAQACRTGLEGIVSKLRAGPARAGRTDEWQKTKCVRRQEFVIGGFTEPEGSREGIGSLLIGHYEGPHLRWAGKVGTGTGWNGAFLRDLRARLERIESPRAPFDPPVSEPGLRRTAHWVRPQLVAEIGFAEWTADGRVRHPSMQGLRADKVARDVVRERPHATAAPTRRKAAAAVATPTRKKAAAAATAPTGKKTAPAVPAAVTGSRARRMPAKAKAKASASALSSADSTDGTATVAGMRITHPDRVTFADVGVTKLDIARYYDAVAEVLLPHVRGRPLTLLHCGATIDPAAEKGGCIMLRHAKAWGPSAIRRVRIEELRKTGEYLVADSHEAVVALAQMGVVELHTWNATAERPYQHDRVVLDLDPGPAVPWDQVVAAARLVRAALSDLGLRSWVKTTGGKGLHVVAPIVPADAARCLAFSRAVADALARREPTLLTTAMAKAGREGLILLDVFRNNRTNTSVAAYALRARAGAPVSMPLRWEDLGPRLDPRAFDIRTVPGRVTRRADPWRDYWSTRQSLPGSAASTR
jgi:bifunctional non-homologous end joining protein LigD